MPATRPDAPAASYRRLPLEIAICSRCVPNCDFYALDDDCRAVLDFIFDQDGWVLYELASRPDQKVRTFHSTADVRDAAVLGTRETLFLLYAPEMRGRVEYRRITFLPGAVEGATFRYDTAGSGLIQLYFGALRADGRLTNSHTNHNSEIRARTWASTYPALLAVEEWDWPGVNRVSGKLVRFIRKLAVDKLGSRPVLPAAHAARSDGRAQLALSW